MDGHVGGIAGATVGYIDDGRVNNIGIDNCSAKTEINIDNSKLTSCHLGGLVGWNRMAISNSHAELKIRVKDTLITEGNMGNCGIGGLVGVNNTWGNRHTIQKSYAKIDYKDTSKTTDNINKYYIGGFAGTNASNIKNSYAIGKISLGENDAGAICGGLLGWSQGTITDAYAHVDIVGKRCDIVGGLTGKSEGTSSYLSTFKNTYVIGQINVENANKKGGLIGQRSPDEQDLGETIETESITYSYWVPELVGIRAEDSTEAGITRTKNEMTVRTNFVPWDFTNVWAIDEGNSLPYLLGIKEDAITLEGIVVKHVKANDGALIKNNIKNTTNPVEGAEIALCDEDGNILKNSDETDVMLITTEDGEVDFSDIYRMIPGTYYYKQVSVPTGYVINNNIYTFTIDNVGDTAYGMNNGIIYNEANKYTVVLDNQNATTSGTISVTATFGCPMPTIVKPTREGATFEGYYSQQEGEGTKYYNDTGITAHKWDIPESTTLYANWIIDSYNITLNTNGGTINEGNVEIYYYGTGATLPTNVTKENYVFAGWYTNEGLTGAPVRLISTEDSGDKTYYAKWKEDLNGDGVPDEEQYRTITYTDGVADQEVFADKVISTALDGLDTPAFGDNPIRENYVFTGWNPEVAEKVNGDATYTAKWKEDRNGDGVPDDEEQKYTVTFVVGEHGKFKNTTERTIVVENLLSGLNFESEINIPEAEADVGYCVGSWSPELPTNIPAENVTYTMSFEANTNTSYKIQYYLRTLDREVPEYELKTEHTVNKTGTTSAIVEVQENEIKTIEGFTYDSSNTGNVLSGTIAGDGSLVLKLYYERDTYNIEYELNGGQANNLPQTYLYGKEMILSNNVSKENSTFLGWYSDSELTQKVLKIEIGQTGNKKFYAKWSETNEYFVTTTGKYQIEDNYVKNVSPKTTVESFLRKIETNGEKTVLDKDGNQIAQDSNVGTGSILQITHGANTYRYEIVVSGDISGDGLVSILDLSLINQHMLRKITLEGANFKAGDLNSDSDISLVDLSMLNQAITGKIVL